MKLLVAAIGKAKPSPEAQLFADYTKRLPWKITLKEWAATTPEKEAALLLAACDGYERIIALDERGKNMSSRELAGIISGWQQGGASSVACIIGGADGLHESVRKRADLLLSFGALTWPHMLVRAMLAEQLYRAHSIWVKHPYHRD